MISLTGLLNQSSPSYTPVCPGDTVSDIYILVVQRLEDFTGLLTLLESLTTEDI